MYDAKHVLVDLGFVEGYCQDGNSLPNNWGMFEALLDAIDRISEYAIKGSLEDSPRDKTNYANFLHDIGYVRGLLWAHPISGAVSEALKRVIAFVTEKEEFPYTLLDGGDTMSESAGQRLSDDHRDKVLDANKDDDVDTMTAAFADRIEAPLAGITHYWRKMGAIDRQDEREILAENAAGKTAPSLPEDTIGITAVESCDNTQVLSDSAIAKDEHKPLVAPTAPESETLINPFNPSGKMGKREWTPEQRAAQAERAKGRKKPPFDDDLDAVKADFDAGMSPLKIGRKWGCSDSHIRNFLTKHGIDPRRQKIELPPYEATPRDEYEWDDESRARLFAMRDEGKTWKEIGDALGRTPSACSSMFTMLVKAGKAPPKQPTPAQTASLASDDIQEVQEMLDKDSSYEAIGEWFGCDAEAVRAFCQEHKLIPAKKMAEVKENYEARLAAMAGSRPVGSDAAEDQNTNRPGAVVAEDGEQEISESTSEASNNPRLDPDPEPSPPHRLSVAHPGYAGKREDGQLVDSDWPDIKEMLAQGRERRLIASDFDADLEDLEFFISSNQRREAKQPPGEARAPLPGLKGGAN